MSDTKAAKAEILRDLDRAIVNMESLEHKQFNRDQRDEIVWALKIMRVARKAISETLADKVAEQTLIYDAEGRN